MSFWLVFTITMMRMLIRRRITTTTTIIAIVIMISISFIVINYIFTALAKVFPLLRRRL